MFNNRMLAIAAVLVMAVPALGAATPIVVDPVPEQLVEGHTVFTVIEIVQDVRTDVNETRFAAAVAVLVREFERRDAQVNQRFPGVLWFNDQYLVNPESQDQAAAANRFRYPCGGAVLAVNAGDPDPRMVMASVTTPLTGEVTVGDDTHTYDTTWTEPTPGTYTYDNDFAWLGADLTTTTVWSDTVLTNSIDYEESYLITDPNDHSWVIDKYNFYTRTTEAGAGADGALYDFPVWAVNILGSPVFIPDDPLVPCLPYIDLYQVQAALTGGNTGCGASAIATQPGVYTDDPCMSYEEPSRWTGADGAEYCYGGQSSVDGCYQGETGNCDYRRHISSGTTPAAGCGYDGAPPQVNTPLRRYNALLYFKLNDLTDAGAPRDHTEGSTDTNGCSQELDADYGYATQSGYDWECPGGDDDAEGNSHPFHPSAPPHLTAEACPEAFYGTNPTNHGGSTYVAPGDPVYGSGEWYRGDIPCDFLHATRDIDVYFSGAGRPFPPVVRDFVVQDLEGSSAPFHDYHCAYEGTC
jgi:hypothetical protein